MSDTFLERVDAALVGVRPALEAGGYDLSAGGVDADGTVVLVLAAGETACAECVMPDEFLVQIAGQAMADHGLSDTAIRLKTTGFDKGV